MACNNYFNAKAYSVNLLSSGIVKAMPLFVIRIISVIMALVIMAVGVIISIIDMMLHIIMLLTTKGTEQCSGLQAA